MRAAPVSLSSLPTPGARVLLRAAFCTRRAHPFDWLADKDHFGVPVYHFGVTERALGDPRVYPENRGFCMPDGTLADCHDAGGVLDAASANFGTVLERLHVPNARLTLVALDAGSPLYISWPHFFLADRRYLEAVRGLHGPSEDFRTMVDIEPVRHSWVKFVDTK